MKTITISTENSETYSSISNFFIDYYMTDANGEFVKVYLYLIRLLNSKQQISVAEIADHFNLTEKDICRAIKYWVTKDALRLTFDGKGQPTGIVVLPLKAPEMELSTESDAFSLLRSDDTSAHVEKADTAERSEKASNKIVPITTPAMELSAPQKPKFTQKDIDKLLRDQDWEDILYQVETLFEKPISQSDTQSLMYIYDTLGFSVDLFEYLIEYCVENGHKSMHYINKVALSWHEENITTVNLAKTSSFLYNKNCYCVLNAYGIKGRGPAASEIAYIRKWSEEYGFALEVILEACDRTMNAIHQPSFDYTDSILKRWKDKNVRQLKDIDAVDADYRKEKERAKELAKERKRQQQAQKPAINQNNKFNNFDGRSYDMNDLERRLVQQ